MISVCQAYYLSHITSYLDRLIPLSALGLETSLCRRPPRSRRIRVNSDDRMRILFIGDIVGRPGRQLVRVGLSAIASRHQIDFVIANGENSAAGFGITREIGDRTARNGRGRPDVWQSHLGQERRRSITSAPSRGLLRPANYPAGVPGNGSYVARAQNGQSVGVINAMGRVFMLNIDDPFAGVLREIEAVRQRARIIFVDFHAEATSEKVAMGWHLDGKVTAVVGTHTHVQTADERMLPKGTAYLTDAGMTGPHDSIIGVEVEPALSRFLTGLPSRFETATANPRLNGVIIDADEATGKATDIERLSYSQDELMQLAADERPLRSTV